MTLQNYGSNPVALKEMCACIYFFCVRRCLWPVVAADVNFRPDTCRLGLD